MKKILIALFLLLASPAFAAVTFDAATSTSTGASDGNTTSHSHTTANQPNRVMYIGITLWRQSAANVGECTSVTYNSVAATRLDHDRSGSSQHAGEIWRLIAPATGTNTVAVTCDAAVERVVTGVITAYGVDQVTPDDGLTFQDGVTSSCCTWGVSSAVGELVFVTASVRSTATACAPGASEDERWDVQTTGTGTDAHGCGYTEPGATGTVNVIPTYTGDADFVVGYGVSINATTDAAKAPRMIQ